MKCSRCGQEIVPGDSFCTCCGLAIPNAQQPTPVPVQKPIANDNQKANQLCIFSLLLYLAAPFVLGILGIFISAIFKNETIDIGTSLLGVIARIAAIVMVIVARVKYPTSKFAKVLLWIYIGLFIAGLLLLILIAVIFFLLAYQYIS